MIRHPEVQRKAQAQIDEIVGNGQLPTLEARVELPYIDCILKEVMRCVIRTAGTPYEYLISCLSELIQQFHSVRQDHFIVVVAQFFIFIRSTACLVEGRCL